MSSTQNTRQTRSKPVIYSLDSDDSDWIKSHDFVWIQHLLLNFSYITIALSSNSTKLYFQCQNNKHFSFQFISWLVFFVCFFDISNSSNRKSFQGEIVENWLRIQNANPSTCCGNWILRISSWVLSTVAVGFILYLKRILIFTPNTNRISIDIFINNEVFTLYIISVSVYIDIYNHNNNEGWTSCS